MKLISVLIDLALSIEAVTVTDSPSLTSELEYVIVTSVWSSTSNEISFCDKSTYEEPSRVNEYVSTPSGSRSK